jgi:hypothetical protein
MLVSAVYHPAKVVEPTSAGRRDSVDAGATKVAALRHDLANNDHRDAGRVYSFMTALPPRQTVIPRLPELADCK